MVATTRGLVHLGCPFCGSPDAGRYNPDTRRFLCSDLDCPRSWEVVDYSAFVEELARQSREFDRRYPGLAEGAAEPPGRPGRTVPEKSGEGSGVITVEVA